MSKLPNLKELVFRDTPFANLMNKRIFNVLLIATKYDAFMLEDDGRVDEQISNEYHQLGLSYPPRFTQVTTTEEALDMLADRHFELIIVMPNMDQRDAFSSAREIKSRYPGSMIVVLTPFSKEVSKRFEREDLSSIDYVFSWLGNAELLLAEFIDGREMPGKAIALAVNHRLEALPLAFRRQFRSSASLA